MRTQRARGKPPWQIVLAKERILILLEEAKKAAGDEPERARRYTKLAKKIGMRYNVRLGALKRRFCKHCFTYFTTANSRQRLKNGILRVKCFSCGKIMSVPYKPKK